MQSKWMVLACAAAAGSMGCDAFGDGSGQAQQGARGSQCRMLDFDTDGYGDPIQAGEVLANAYLPYGVEIATWRKPDRSKEGLGVAFDSNNPTGGDWDLAYEDQGMLLISQETFSDAEVAAGRVDEPDDDARGAMFEFWFDTPACVDRLTVLDIDKGEEATIRLFDRQDELLSEIDVPVTGDNGRVTMDIGHCRVDSMTVTLSSSGALDDLALCFGSIDGGGGDPRLPDDWTIPK